MSGVTGGRRIRGHLSWQRVDLRLRAAREIWVALTRTDGDPHAVPVWFWWDGEALYFTARAGTLKPVSLERRPAIVAHNGDGADPIIIHGTAKTVTDQGERDRVDAAYQQKYVDPRSGAGARVHPTDDAVFRVAIDRIEAWSYANASTRTVWRFG